ncbi:hypothetical protein F2Q68_00034074 [Brassica cretica]|uniref:Uncharacterized protein n=1 Tax=Brassica cretica TaxID=69181 RepID=A0A8S9H4G8_BRACR|nr:hypothetical protein F2Q68_00034074 [Brassica cretica]
MNSALVMELILGSCTVQRPYWEHERRWEVDDANLRQIVPSLKDPRDALWLDIFPEGRDYIFQDLQIVDNELVLAQTERLQHLLLGIQFYVHYV